MSMQRVYSQMTNVPATMLIFSDEKLQAPGYRWAPRTLLGSREVSRTSMIKDHTIRHHQLGIRFPDTLPRIPSQTHRANQRLDFSDWTGFEWGKSPVKRIFFKSSCGTTYYPHLPEDANSILSAAKSITIPMHDTISHCLAVVVRGVPIKGLMPAALVAVTTIADGKATLSPSPDEPVLVDGGAVHDVDYGRDDEHLMPDGRSWGQARRDLREAEARPHIESHVLTDCVGWARWHLVTGEADEKHVTKIFDLETGFDGIEPWDRSRVVCTAEEVDLITREVWIA